MRDAPPERNESDMRQVDLNGIAYEEFDSIHEFLTLTAERGENKWWKGHRLSSQRYEYSSGFTATPTWESAVELLERGWDYPLNKMRDSYEVKIAADHVERKTRAKTEYRPVGHTPSVPRALMGHPNAMIRTRRETLPAKTIHLMYDTSVAGGVDTDTMTKCGITMLEVVSIFERQGYRVKLTVTASSVLKNSMTGKKGIIGGIVVKDYRDSLDIKKLCFPLAHPSMFRRIFFRHVETTPLMGEWYDSYGHGTFNGDFGGGRERIREAVKGENGAYIFVQDIKSARYDAAELMKRLDLVK